MTKSSKNKQSARASNKKVKAAKTPSSSPDAVASSKAHTKQGILVNLLQGSKGATVDEMVEATGWQRHSVQGVMSGALKKKLGLAITSEKEQRGRVYRIGGAGK